MEEIESGFYENVNRGNSFFKIFFDESSYENVLTQQCLGV